MKIKTAQLIRYQIQGLHPAAQVETSRAVDDRKFALAHTLTANDNSTQPITSSGIAPPSTAASQWA